MVEQTQTEVSPLAATSTTFTPSRKCLYCSGEQLAPLFAEVRDRLCHVAGTWQFLKCAECGSALLWPQPDPAELPSYYPPVYSFHPDLGQHSRVRRVLSWLEHTFFFLPQYRHQARRVLSRISLTEGRVPQLLDIGCGRGLRLRAFQSLGFECCGADFQEQVVADVRRRLHIPVARCDIQGLPEHFAPASFDVITAFFLLEHVPDVRQVLTTCHTLLVPGGWFVGVVPFLDSVQCAVFGRRWPNVSEAPRHLSLPTQQGMRTACEATGYNQVSIGPDSCLNCAGQVASSILPSASITQTYGEQSRLGPFLLRVIGGGITISAIPLVLAENYLVRRPAMGMVFARRPPVR